MSDRLQTEQLARSVERYLFARYGDQTLASLLKRRIQSEDHGMALNLREWRKAANWPHPDVIGETRCVDCMTPLGDRGSACEDEDVCHACAKAGQPLADSVP